MSWFGEARALSELRKQRLALERIATVLEANFVREGKTRGTSLLSFHKDESEDYDGEVIVQNDGDYAEFERLEREREEGGGEVGMDDPLTRRR